MTNTIGMKLVFLKGGTFNMGNYRVASEDGPAHKVRVSGFWIGQYHVTNAQFDFFKKRPRTPESLANNQPAVNISWTEATDFCRWLSKREKRRYRLPTEAEWEYAARGGRDLEDYPWGNESVDGRACFSQITTCPVGSFSPNGFGLYDMVGNALQWTNDWYASDYYANSPSVNPLGAPKPSSPDERFHVLRGGHYPFFELTCWNRYPWSEDIQSIAGLRIVMDGNADSFSAKFSPATPAGN